MKKIFLWILIVNFALVFSTFAQKKEKYWLFFTDKGVSSSVNLNKLARQSLSERAVKRRILRGNPARIFDETDLPVFPSYLEQIRETGVKICNRSKWLNAVSVEASAGELANLKQMNFVKKISRVATFIRSGNKTGMEISPRNFRKFNTVSGNIYNYGPSLPQLQLINVPALHNAGLTGKGVLVTLLDSGFNYETHQAFKHLNLLAEWDFVFHDGSTQNDSTQDSPSQDNHGSKVLSLIGGFLPGSLIGPAFGATFALAKTEYIPSETRVEEDNWVAGIEWADSLGTDIVSTSLGYRDFDNGFAYTYDELDGQTMVTSIAAHAAVEKGIVVVAAAGNEGGDSKWPYVISPAEGIGVIAVGAVNEEGSRVSFSSIGPTADGRIKPDLMAMGYRDVTASPTDTTKILTGSGTSFATPLVAGVCALLLENNPGLKPADVYNALTSTASQAQSPDNFYGWGIIDALKAVEMNKVVLPTTLKINSVKIDPVQGYTYFVLDVPETGELKLTIFNALGQKVETEAIRQIAGNRRSITWQWPANIAAGVYFARFQLSQRIKTQKFVVFR